MQAATLEMEEVASGGLQQKCTLIAFDWGHIRRTHLCFGYAPSLPVLIVNIKMKVSVLLTVYLTIFSLINKGSVQLSIERLIKRLTAEFTDG